MSISISSLLPGVPRGHIQAHGATKNEIQELISERLIGENSSSSPFVSAETLEQLPVTQWSEQLNSQWWALMGDGELGQQAAGFLEQMAAERRQLATGYLDGFFANSKVLAEQLQDSGAASADLDQLLDNVAAGRKPSENADGSQLPKADIIEAFWADNSQQIAQLQDNYQALSDFPSQLSEWLDDNQIDRPAGLDQIVDKHRYSGLNGDQQTSQALRASSRSFLNHQPGSNPTGKNGFIEPLDMFEASPHALTDMQSFKGVQQRSVEMALRLGDAGTLKHAMSAQLMHAERKSMLSSYQQLYQPLSDTFYNSLKGLTPGYSLQDMLDNLAADLPPGQMADGTLHPQAELMQQFADQHRSSLDAINLQQAALDDLPRNRTEWLASDSNTGKAEMAVYQQYGIEPWETGSNIRALRPNSWQGVDYFESQSPEKRQQLLDKAQARIERLRSELQTSLSGLVSEGFDLDQLIENFRFNRPLGLMKDGGIHPNADKIEAMFATNQDEFVAHIDSQWLLGKEANLSKLDYSNWMTQERASDYTQELLDLISDSQRVLSLDELLKP